jgi:oxygen-independent coproporphyrinogen-3 oxidase
MASPVKQARTQPPHSPPWLTPRAAYVHIPFCAHRCWYCDFAVVAGKDGFAERYLDALERELALQTPSADTMASLFIGGGTPTHLADGHLEHLFAMLRDRLPMSDGCEITIEANPNDLSNDRIRLLAELGVNRVSLGIQSFNDEHLRFLERQHTSESAVAAIRRCQDHIPKVSIDLIFGTPGQSLDDWDADLTTAVELGVEHISTYGLTYEKGTRLWQARERGNVVEAAQELEAAMYEHAMDRLTAAGLTQYEISNFARPGSESTHNRVYWANYAYWGLGLGAARYVNGTRSINTRSLTIYLRKLDAGQLPTQSEETLGPRERARETAMVNLRRREGIVRQLFLEHTGFHIDDLIGAALRRHRAAGLLLDDGHAITLTRAGKLLADGVCADFWNEE